MKYFFLIFIFVTSIANSSAHEGPPYPILVDHPFNQYKLSVWADPDTEKGTFLFYPEGEKNALENFIFEIRATPKDLTKKEILKAFALKSDVNEGKVTYTATVPFPFEATWNVDISVKNKQNGDILTTITLPVEVTPPGPSPMESLVYTLPFVIVFGIWLKVVLKKRKKRATHP